MKIYSAYRKLKQRIGDYPASRETTVPAKIGLVIICICLMGFGVHVLYTARQYEKGLFRSYEFYQESRGDFPVLTAPEGTVYVSTIDEVIADMEKSFLKSCVKMLTISSISEQGLKGYIWLGDISISDGAARKRYQEIMEKGRSNVLQAQADLLSRLNAYFCHEDAVLRFVSCRSESPYTRAFLESVFPGVEIILYEKQVGWFLGFPLMKPFWMHSGM